MKKNVTILQAVFLLLIGINSPLLSYRHTVINNMPFAIKVYIGYFTSLCGDVKWRTVPSGDHTDENAGICDLNWIGASADLPNGKHIEAHIYGGGSHRFTGNGTWTVTGTEDNFEVKQTDSQGLGSIIAGGLKDAASQVNNHVIKPVYDTVIKPGVVQTYKVIAQPVYDAVGRPIVKYVVVPAYDAVGKPIVEDVLNPILDKTHVAGLLKEGWEKITDATGIASIGNNIKAGADQLQKAPDQFKVGIDQLKKMPDQLQAGVTQLIAAIAKIGKASSDAQKQQMDIEAKNLPAMGMKALHDNLISALNNLQAALTKLANTSGKGFCSGGVLCKLLAVMLDSETSVTKQIPLIEAQIAELQAKISTPNEFKQTLIDRMKAIGNALAP